MVAGDNARIQRKLAAAPAIGAWRTDAGPRHDAARRVPVRRAHRRSQTEPGPGNADPGESGPDTINGNGGNDILLGQDNGQADTAAADAYGSEDGTAGAANCQTSLGPGTGDDHRRDRVPER